MPSRIYYLIVTERHAEFIRAADRARLARSPDRTPAQRHRIVGFLKAHRLMPVRVAAPAQTSAATPEACWSADQ